MSATAIVILRWSNETLEVTPGGLLVAMWVAFATAVVRSAGR